MFQFGQSVREGWFFTPTFNVYQKVNNKVYVYVSRQFGFYTLQMYERGTTGLCTLEARAETNIEELFKLGEEWLQQHEDYNQETIQKSPYYIGKRTWRESCWVS